MTPALIDLQKHLLRTKIRQYRQNLSDDFVMANSEIIGEKVLTGRCLDAAETVLVYVSKPKEVQTHQLIKKLLKEGKTVAVPKVTGPQQMKAVKISDFNQLEPGYFDVLEPKNGRVINQPIDLNSMPAVAVDKRGHRLGMGRGFYDHFIRKNQPRRNLAVVFDKQIRRRIPVRDFDETIDTVVSPGQLIEN